MEHRNETHTNQCKLKSIFKTKSTIEPIALKDILFIFFSSTNSKILKMLCYYFSFSTRTIKKNIHCIALCKFMLNEKYKFQVPVFQGWAEQGILTASDGPGYVLI